MPALKVVEFPSLGEVPEISDLIRELAERSASGDVRAVGFVLIDSEGETTTGWGWDGGVDTARLIGGSTVLTHRLVRELDPEASG